MSDTTIKDLEEKCQKLANLREEIETDKRALSVKNEMLENLEGNLMAELKEIGKSSYKSEYGTVMRTEKWRVNLPKTPEEKVAFFNYLKEKGHFDDLITVNSQTLNSYFTQEWEAVKKGDNPEEAIGFTLPGLEQPKLFETLAFRRK